MFSKPTLKSLKRQPKLIRNIPSNQSITGAQHEKRKKAPKRCIKDNPPKVAHHLEFETTEELEDFCEGVIVGRLIDRCMAENIDWRPLVKELMSIFGKKGTTC